MVKVTDALVPDAFQRFENEWSPEQEIVRCKDCIYWKNGHSNYYVHNWLPCMEIETNREWFCAEGRKEGSS